MPDLFLSYAHVDKHWVDTFAPQLEQRINQYAGRAKPDRIWKDNRFASKALTQFLGSRFWWQEANSKRTYPLNPGEPGFEKYLIDLAKDIAALLRGENLPQAASASSLLCKREAGGDFLQQKRESLEKRRALLHELLTRQQEELTFADDPKRQMRLERDINATNARLAQVETELARYS